MKKTMMMFAGLFCVMIGSRGIVKAEDVPQLVPVSENPVIASSVGGEKIMVRGKHSLLINPRPGEDIEIKATTLWRNRNPFYYTLLGPDGKEVASGEFSRVKPDTVSISIEKAGTYRLTIDSWPGGNACHLELSNRYVVFESPIHLFTTAMQGYFYVPDGVKKFAVKIRGAGSSEHADITIYDNKGDEVIQGDTKNGQPGEGETVVVTAPEGSTDSTWSFRIGKVPEESFEDAFLEGFSGNIPPYISDDPERLLKPGE